MFKELLQNWLSDNNYKQIHEYDEFDVRTWIILHANDEELNKIINSAANKLYGD